MLLKARGLLATIENNQTQTNLVANILSFIVGTAISFILTPYLVSQLGAEAYGFFPLALSVYNYSTIVTFAMNSMASRFIAVEEHQGNTALSLVYFNTVFFSNIVIAIVLAIVAAVFVACLDRLLQVPYEIIGDVRILFALVFAGSLISLATSVYDSATFVKNRIDLQALATVLSKIIQSSLIFVLFSVSDPSIVILGIAFLALITTQLIVKVTAKRALLPHFKLSIWQFSGKAARHLLGAGIWRSFAQISSILLVGLDLTIANIFLGAAASGVLAIAKTIPSLIWSFSNTVAIAFVPGLVQTYAQQDRQQLVEKLKKSFNVLNVFTPIILGGFLVLGQDFYRVWLPGQDISLLYTLSILTLLPTALSAGVLSLDFVFLITNRLRADALFMLTISFTNIIVVLLLITHTPMGLFAIAGVSSFFEIARRLIFWPIFTAKYCSAKWYTFYPDYFKSWLCTAVVIGTGSLVRAAIPIDSWVHLILVGGITTACSFCINLFLINDKDINYRLLRLVSSANLKLR